MTRHPDVQLSAYATGGLAGQELADTERHLAECAACRGAVADYREILQQLALTAPAPPEVAWPRYRAELRARRDARVPASRGARRGWLRPVPVALSTAIVAACALVFFSLARETRMPSDLAAAEYEGLAPRVEMLDHYRVVDQLDLLEDLDVIRNLDRLTSTRDS